MKKRTQKEMKKIVYIMCVVSSFFSLQALAQSPTTEFGEASTYGEMFGFDDLFETEQLLGLEEVYTGDQTAKEKEVFVLKEFYTDVVDMNADLGTNLYKEMYFEEYSDIAKSIDGSGQGELDDEAPLGSGVMILLVTALAYASLIFVRRKNKSDLSFE